MQKYEPIPGVKIQIITQFQTLNSLLADKFDRSKLVKAEGNKLGLINVSVKNRTLYFACENLRDLESGIIATTYDGGYGYIGLPVKAFKPEYQKQIMEQLRERHGGR